MVKVFNRITDAINMVSKIIAVVLLLGIVICCALQVCSRHVPAFQVLGMEELARALFVWMISLGMSLAIGSGGHMRIDIIAQKIPEKMKNIYEIAIQLCIMAFCAVMIIFGLEKVSAVAGQITPLFALPYTVLYMSLVVGSILGAINVVNNILNIVSRKDGEGKEAA